jgi:hypothetical protein
MEISKLIQELIEIQNTNVNIDVCIYFEGVTAEINVVEEIISDNKKIIILTNKQEFDGSSN